MSGLERIFGGMRSTSMGLSAERTRMDIIAQNIANARTTKTANGQPYRRQLVRFEPIMEKDNQGNITALGVRAAEVLKDYDTPMDRIYDPVNPDANSDGFVEMPNVSATREMADLVTAMRAYEANLKVQENFSQMAERALRLAR
jgi:flagellar basal-body rod protein FlgC